MVGRAMPVLEADCAGPEVSHLAERQPFGLMLTALDDLHPGEIYLCGGASPTYALWGPLMTTRARYIGAVGAVLDGFCRDSKEIAQLDFPVFARGCYAQDQAVRVRVIDFRCKIRLRNGTIVRPEDIVVGDVDGMVIIPAEHEQAVVADALKKVRGEDLVRKALQQGMNAAEAFKNVRSDVTARVEKPWEARARESDPVCRPNRQTIHRGVRGSSRPVWRHARASRPRPAICAAPAPPALHGRASRRLRRPREGGHA